MRSNDARYEAEVPIPNSEDEDLELDRDIVHEALEAKAKAGSKSSFRPPTRAEADEPIRLSADELLQLLPYLDKHQKKKLQSQLLT